MDSIIEQLGENCVIRYAQRENCENLLTLIQELADSLDSSLETHIDDKTLVKYGFDLNPQLFKCLVIEDLSSNSYENRNGDEREVEKLVAYAMFSFSFSSWYGKGLYLEDIYIRESYRGKGFGTALFRNIAKIALESNCQNITLFVFKTNAMKEFFISKGAKNLTENNGFDYYKIEKESLNNLVNTK